MAWNTKSFLKLEPGISSQYFQTTIYGAMVMARAYGDPGKFSSIIEASLAQMRGDSEE